MSSVEEYLHSFLQLGNSSRKFIVTVAINGVNLDIEANLGEERTTIPWSIFQEKLSHNCNSRLSSVKLLQYDQSPLVVKGECTVTVQIHDWVIDATFIAVDVSTLYPLFGRDWMYLLGVDVSRLIQSATQIHSMNSVLISSPQSNYLLSFQRCYRISLACCEELKFQYQWYHMQLLNFIAQGSAICYKV